MSRRAVVGLVLVVLWGCVGLLAPVLAPYPQGHLDLARPLASPGPGHVLGTTEDGVDVLSALIWGARVALIVGVATVLLSVTVGTAVGLASGWYGGVVDQVLMRLIEVFLSFPGFLLALLIVFALGQPSLLGVILALNATGWAPYARLMRAQVLSVRTRDYVVASRAMGAGSWHVLRWHVLPNAIGPVLVQGTFGVAGAVVAEASLSFLGLGPQDATSWGALLAEGAALFIKVPALGLWAGACLLVTVLGLQLLGEALRDRLDPRSLRMSSRA